METTRRRSSLPGGEEHLNTCKNPSLTGLLLAAVTLLREIAALMDE